VRHDDRDLRGGEVSAIIFAFNRVLWWTIPVERRITKLCKVVQAQDLLQGGLTYLRPLA
jgi:hypothetical protein